MNEQTAIKAARWWVEQIKNRTCGDPKLDGNGSSIYAAQVALNQRSITVTDRQLEVFEAQMREYLINRNGYQSLMVDYQPDIYLGAILDEAGISHDVLSGKIHMNIDGDKITVHVGYGTPSVEI